MKDEKFSFEPDRDFRAIKSAVSLKLRIPERVIRRDDLFPRHQKRGLIEARLKDSTKTLGMVDFRTIKSVNPSKYACPIRHDDT